MSDRTKVGLLVHYSYNNYGNHLTNFAARRVLEECHSDVDMIVLFGGKFERWLGALGRMPARLMRVLRDGELGGKLAALARRFARSSDAGPEESSPVERARLARFAEFSAEWLRPRFVPVRKRFTLEGHYDIFVVGSDQIWNYDHDLGPWFFLDFAGDAVRACLAPSVGHRQLPKEWVSYYKRWLSRFSEVTVREANWVDEFRELLGSVPVTLLPDPTLMLPVEAWDEVCSDWSHEHPYLLVYELGALSAAEREFAAEWATHGGLETLWLSPSSPDTGWASNAADFLAMVRGASAVLTDSYHGCVFAFLFDRPLVILPRSGAAAGMNTRIETLTGQLGLGDRSLGSQTPQTAFDHDYSDGRSALEGLRTVTWEYLARHGMRAPSGVSVQEGS